jgi:deoxyribonuclease IV
MHPADGGPKRRIGPHLPLAGGMRKAAARAQEIGATAVQVFTDNPTAWRRRSEPPPERDEFRAMLAAADIAPLAVHAPYLVNLCGPDPEFWEHSIETLGHELEVGETFGASLVAVHIGSHRGEGREQGIERLAEGLARVFERTPTGGPLLALENSAGTGDGLGAALEDLADIQAATDRLGIPAERFGFCLDTAHLWGAGYDLRDLNAVDELMRRLDALIGRDRLAMLHLNDSRAALGSRMDRHEHIGAGQIGPVGMRAMLCHPWLATVPTFLETPGMDSGYDAINLQRARLLIDGQPLPDLPAEAFTMRSSRSRTGPASDLTAGH